MIWLEIHCNCDDLSAIDGMGNGCVSKNGDQPGVACMDTMQSVTRGYSRLGQIARSQGWVMVPKHGWFCPHCKTKLPSKTDT